MREQISLMLQNNTISEISPDTPGFYSKVFLARKASGGWRPVINLKQLNHHIDAPHFCMHTISSVVSTIERGDYALKIDLQDAYFHVLILSCTRRSSPFSLMPRPRTGAPTWGFSDCGCMDPFRTRAPHQCPGAQDGNIGPSSLGYSITGPSCFECYRQYHCCSLHQQTRWDPFPPPVAAGSGSVSVATDSEHNSKSQTHSRLPKCDIRPVVSVS